MSASEFLELHLSPDSALEPEHQRECEHYMDDYAASEVKRVAGPLVEALEEMVLIESDPEAIGPSRWLNALTAANTALAAARAEMEAKHE